ncbi:MAG: hypothetical protein J3K34DRAFT_525395 [Monoraphidium minutum]|nr:MAG: hypothetical protein J3K34DRAFT_525395 [Monoraphidium minutum]
MAFWRVAGFAQPSPIEQILDKEDYTLEELLDEDDIVQECKSLNGRLIAFLRERDVVEKLLRYLVQPPSDADDPKYQYRYPFTACEVLCCEVEAVFNALLEDEALLGLLFSPLAGPPPLDCKAAGYFARVAGQLLLRKPGEMMAYLSAHEELLARLVEHVGVTSVADVLKRVAGADDQAAMVFSPAHTQWLVGTRLLDMLLERLDPAWPAGVASNAADILTAVAHAQPSALASKLMERASVAALFRRALAPGGAVLVPALEVAGALLEPRLRPTADPYLAAAGGGLLYGGGGANGLAGGCASPAAAQAANAARARQEALGAMLVYIPELVAFLAAAPPPPPLLAAGAPAADGAPAKGSAPADGGAPADGSAPAAAECAPATPAECGPPATQETPYGLLSPPLGRARLKVAELLAVLLHAGDEGVDGALIASNALQLAMDLFGAYPFNNLLHHQVFYMLRGLLLRGTPAAVAHAFGACGLVPWLAGLPAEVTPAARPRGPPPKGPLRAGYLGHVTRIANLLAEAAAERPAVADALAADAAWADFAGGELRRRNELEDVGRWECGRPSAEMGELGSDGDEFQSDMDLGQQQGVQPGLFHRYGALDEDEEEDGDGGAGGGEGGEAGAAHADGGGDGAAAGDAGAGFGGGAYGTMLAAAMQRVDLGGADVGDGGSGGALAGEEVVVLGDVRERDVEGCGEAGGAQGPDGGWSLLTHAAGAGAAAPGAGAEPSMASMEDDAVLLSTSDDEDGGPAAASSASVPVPAAAAPPAAAVVASSPPGGDAVMVEAPGGEPADTPGEAATAALVQEQA